MESQFSYYLQWYLIGVEKNVKVDSNTNFTISLIATIFSLSRVVKS